MGVHRRLAYVVLIAMQPRHSRIVDDLRRDGSLSVDELAGRLGVTPQTVRRDLRELARDGHVVRARGLAVATQSDVTPTGRRAPREPAGLNPIERHLCRVAAARLQHGCSLMLGNGAVAEWTAAALAHRTGIRVVTNSLRVAMSLSSCALDSPGSDSGDIEVIVAGGVMRGKDAAMLGMGAQAFLRDFKVDVVIVGVDGVAPSGALLADDLESAPVLRTLVGQAREIWLVAAHTRFSDERGLATIGELGRLARIFTDVPLPPPISALCTDCVIEIHAEAIAKIRHQPSRIEDDGRRRAGRPTTKEKA
ncbi:DeoR/GlpR family DNA-binding transcription regulator [Burkholderia multivorans]|uniref:DeoR/GlpR family DNA-binding transcription regulator n=1 Tax=Burkholderia multivorans TaxID=87883 RepID=UPI0019D18194|nr:DeoR/GlpR family DNA-binding transcription regulator [Burkholderia multivorans]MBN6738822.1 DeoR/GlpR transcriptional regulator [Burkholderia multivorans]MBN7130095.1 DeoR/GlpR transcriptional regulator [Burkholderia multivorans]MBN8173452.1 DeoR/GlpR transcriptional regulator [Burkholderia multivorans]QSL29423.1 DeoR/GlpR transcriptional regulator [Burkholderia multivorans]